MQLGQTQSCILPSAREDEFLAFVTSPAYSYTQHQQNSDIDQALPLLSPHDKGNSMLLWIPVHVNCKCSHRQLINKSILYNLWKSQPHFFLLIIDVVPQEEWCHLGEEFKITTMKRFVVSVRSEIITSDIHRDLYTCRHNFNTCKHFGLAAC